jgi:hypothetical protein
MLTFARADHTKLVGRSVEARLNFPNVMGKADNGGLEKCICRDQSVV